MIERRKHPRYKVRILIRYKRLDVPLSEWQDNPQIENISLGGILFDAYEKFPVSAILLFKLHVFIEESIAKIIELRARVVGTEEGIATYPTRVAFVDLDETTESELKKFINYLS